jgi:hypothetical protein
MLLNAPHFMFMSAVINNATAPSFVKIEKNIPFARFFNLIHCLISNWNPKCFPVNDFTVRGYI